MANKEKIFKKILQILFYLSLIAPLLVDRRLFFPYVTSNALYFRFFAELVLFLWLVFILFYPKYRPKINVLSGSLLIYILVLIAATIFSANIYLSFWGDAERMMGLFGLLHFVALFFVGSSIFKEKKDLKTLLNIFLAISSALALHGIFQRLGLTSIKPGEERIVATLGNSAILASYLIFGLFLSIYQGLKNLKSFPAIIYGLVALLHLAAIFLTGTRGAFLGIAAGFLFAILILGFLSKNKKVKLGLLALIIFSILFYSLIYFSQNKGWVRNNAYLYRISHISLSDNTIQSRFMSWKWGIEGFKDKPLIGWGFENYVAPFNKYFEARYYNLATEEYFDRPHNIIVEHLATTGVLGAVAYLLFLVSAFYFILKTHREQKDSVYLAIFGGLLLAYFTQNLFLFDSPPSLIGLGVLLVLVNNWRGSLLPQTNEQGKTEGARLRPAIIFILALIIGVLFFYSFSRTILASYRALKDNVAGQVYMDDYKKGIDYLKKSVSRNTILDIDLRSSSANTIYNYYVSGGAGEDKKGDLDFAVDLYKKNLALMPDDAYYNFKLAEILNFRSSVDHNEQILNEAKSYIDKAVVLSPQRATVRFILVENLLIAGKFDEAIKEAQATVALNDKFGASWWELAKAQYIKQDYINAKDSLVKAVELGHHVGEQNIEQFMPFFNIQQGNENAIAYYELIVKSGTNNYLIYSTLANLYLQTGQKEKAIEAAEISAQLNPSTREKVNKFIENVKTKY
ncbi:MAG: O-antigen ligase family protein [Candidatus Portnoybacteria bacterium]|nr:O-antigen ligase family protein [Candidatus Portnoybacteria bacterium]